LLEEEERHSRQLVSAAARARHGCGEEKENLSTLVVAVR
jgi:hypothetical protein